MRQGGRHELVDRAAVQQGDLLEVEAHQCVGAAANLERVVTADRGVPLAVIADHHRVVDEVRLAGFEHRAYSIFDQVVGGDLGVDLERDVRHGLAQRALDTENRAGDAAVVRSEIEVREGVGLHAIDPDPEPAQFGVELFVADLVGDERGQHLVEVAEVHGIAGDARDVGVHHL